MEEKCLWKMMAYLDYEGHALIFAGLWMVMEMIHVYLEVKKDSSLSLH